VDPRDRSLNRGEDQKKCTCIYERFVLLTIDAVDDGSLAQRVGPCGLAGEVSASSKRIKRSEKLTVLLQRLYPVCVPRSPSLVSA